MNDSYLSTRVVTICTMFVWLVAIVLAETTPTPEEESSSDSGGFSDGMAALVISLIVIGMLILVFLLCVRVPMRRSVQKKARTAVSEEFEDRLRVLNDNVLRIVVEELQRGFPKVTPPSLVVDSGVNSVVLEEPTEVESTASGMTTDTNASDGRKKRKLRMASHGHSQAIHQLVNEAISALQVKASTSQSANKRSPMATMPGCPVVASFEQLQDHIVDNNAVLSYTRTINKRVYSRIEDAIKQSLGNLFKVPRPLNVPEDKMTEEMAAQQDEDREWVEEHMPSSCCCYRWLCICRSDETKFCHNYRRLFFYDLSMAMSMGVSQFDDVDPAKKKKNEAGEEEGDSAAVDVDDVELEDLGSSGGGRFSRNAAIYDHDMSLMSNIMFNSAGYLQRKYVNVYQSCKKYVQVNAAGEIHVKKNKKMFSRSESERKLHALFNPLAPVGSGRSHDPGSPGGADTSMFSDAGHGGTASGSVLTAPVRDDVDMRYFSVGHLREDVYAFLKNLQHVVMRGESTCKGYYNMFDIIPYYDAEVKRWARDVTAVVSHKVASDWKVAAMQFLRFQAKVDGDRARDGARSLCLEIDPQSIQPRSCSTNGAMAEQFDAAHASALVEEALRGAIANYKKIFVESERVPDPEHLCPAGMPPTIPDIPAIRKLPAGEKAVYDELSNELRQRTVADMMPEEHVCAARGELEKARRHIIDFLFPIPEPSHDGRSSPAFENHSFGDDENPEMFSPQEGDSPRSPSAPSRKSTAPDSELDLVAKLSAEVARDELEEITMKMVNGLEMNFAERIFSNHQASSEFLKQWLKLVKSTAESKMKELAAVLTALKSAHAQARTVGTLRKELGGQYDGATRNNLQNALDTQHTNLTLLAKYPRFAKFLPIAQIADIYNHCAEIMGAPTVTGDVFMPSPSTSRNRRTEAEGQDYSTHHPPAAPPPTQHIHPTAGTQQYQSAPPPAAGRFTPPPPTAYVAADIAADV